MALHEFPDLDQGTEEWLAARRGIVTASVVGQLLTATGRPASNDTSRRLTLSLVAERITGETEPVWVNDDMLRGQLDEPIARDLYQEHFAQGEEVERHRVTIHAGGDVIRTVEVGAPAMLYETAQELADFGSPQVVLDVELAQLSTVAGPGLAWRGLVTVR